MLNIYKFDLTELQQDLKHFGLNPEDWQVVGETKKTYRILNETDPQFSFKGIKVTNKNSWEKIEFFSL